MCCLISCSTLYSIYNILFWCISRNKLVVIQSNASPFFTSTLEVVVSVSLSHIHKRMHLWSWGSACMHSPKWEPNAHPKPTWTPNLISWLHSPLCGICLETLEKLALRCWNIAVQTLVSSWIRTSTLLGLGKDAYFTLM